MNDILRIVSVGDNSEQAGLIAVISNEAIILNPYFQ